MQCEATTSGGKMKSRIGPFKYLKMFYQYVFFGGGVILHITLLVWVVMNKTYY